MRVWTFKIDARSRRDTVERGFRVFAVALIVLLVCLMIYAPFPISHWTWMTVPVSDALSYTVIVATIAYLLLRRD